MSNFSKRRSVSYLASAARTAAPASVNSINTRGFNNLTVNIEKTAHSSTPSVTFKVQGYDATLDAWYDLLTSAAITNSTTNGVITSLHVGTGVTATSNVGVGYPLPLVVRILPVHGNSDSLTYEVTYTLTQG